jgi:hypothetical protein
VVAKIIMIGIIVGAGLGIIAGVSHFTSEQDTTINDDESTSKISRQYLEHLPLQTQLEKWNGVSGLGILNSIATEIKHLQQMTCDEIIQRNTEGEYLNSVNREFARKKILDCSDLEESFAVNASCEELRERYNGSQKYWFEDHEKITENRLAKCSEEENKK